MIANSCSSCSNTKLLRIPCQVRSSLFRVPSIQPAHFVCFSIILIVAVVDCWGENPPTVKALQHRLHHLKDLAAEYDSGNSSLKSSKSNKTVKKEEGYVTPVSSPKTSNKTPKKAVKKRVADEVGKPVEAGPRRTRRKVTTVKYVDFESDLDSADEAVVKGLTEEIDDEDDEWKPTKVEEQGDDEEEIVAVNEKGAVEKDLGNVKLAPPVCLNDDISVSDVEEERVTEGIKGVSGVLQERMSKSNFEVVV